MRVKPDHIIMSLLFSGVKMSSHPKNAIQSKAISKPKKFLINKRQNMPNTKKAPEDHCVHSSSTDVSRKDPSRIGAGYPASVVIIEPIGRNRSSLMVIVSPVESRRILMCRTCPCVKTPRKAWPYSWARVMRWVITVFHVKGITQRTAIMDAIPTICHTVY